MRLQQLCVSALRWCSHPDHSEREPAREGSPEARRRWDPALARAVDEVGIDGDKQRAGGAQQRAGPDEGRQLPQPYAICRQRRCGVRRERVEEPALSAHSLFQGAHQQNAYLNCSSFTRTGVNLIIGPWPSRPKL